MVAPTTQDRIPSLDVLRGAAILGILLANIFAFGGPMLGMQLGIEYAAPGTNDWVEAIRIALVSGKFRGLFCLLFGIGMYMQFLKMESRGVWPKLYLKRNTWLMVIGLIHGLLIWFGDILFMYSALAFVAMWMVRMSNKGLLIVASSLLTCYFFIGLASALVMSSPMMSGDMMSADFGGFFAMFQPENEIAAFQTGSYLEQLKYRAISLIFVIFGLPLLAFEIVSLFLIGIYMARTGVLTKPSAHPELVKTLLTIGAAGLVLNLVAGLTLPLLDFEWAGLFPEMGLNAPLTIGYATLGAILVERRPKGFISKLLTPVGRTALTCYLLTSVICTTYYYSYGFGQFGRQDYFQMLGFVLVVWVIIIVFAHLWMRKFPMGPIEHLWRTAALGKQTPAEETTPIESDLAPPRIA